MLKLYFQKTPTFPSYVSIIPKMLFILFRDQKISFLFLTSTNTNKCISKSDVTSLSRFCNQYTSNCGHFAESMHVCGLIDCQTFFWEGDINEKLYFIGTYFKK